MEVQINTRLEFATESCCSCAMVFAVPTEWQRNRRKDHRQFYCPNGHPQSYLGETREEARIRELQAQVGREQRAREEAQRHEMVEREARKAVEKKLNRVSAGVCPCCNRSFANLHRHLTAKHPDFVEKGARSRGQKTKKVAR